MIQPSNLDAEPSTASSALRVSVKTEARLVGRLMQAVIILVAKYGEQDPKERVFFGRR